ERILPPVSTGTSLPVLTHRIFIAFSLISIHLRRSKPPKSHTRRCSSETLKSYASREHPARPYPALTERVWPPTSEGATSRLPPAAILLGLPSAGLCESNSGPAPDTRPSAPLDSAPCAGREIARRPRTFAEAS